MNPAVEGILSVAAGCVVLGCLAWLGLALEGLRVVSPVARSSSVADGLAIALVVALVVLVATIRPAPIARDLESAATELRAHGLRRIPLAIYEAATVLDPAAPIYTAEAAALYDDLGLKDAAEAKRELLEARATQFAGAIGAELLPSVPPGMAEPPVEGVPESIGQLPPRELLWIEYP